MPLCLHRAAHDPKAHLWLAALHDEAGNDCVEGAFAWSDLVRVTRLEAGKAASAVLQMNTGAWYDKLRTQIPRSWTG